MGCWVETCGITNLPITENDRAKYVILVYKSDDEHWERRHSGFCYPGELYVPFAPPITGKYNGYGSIEPDKKTVTSTITQKRLTQIGLVGGFKKMLEELERGQVMLDSRAARELVCSREKVYLGRVLILEEVWDAILKQEIKTWQGSFNFVKLRQHANDWIETAYVDYQRICSIEDPKQKALEGFHYDSCYDLNFPGNSFLQAFSICDGGSGLPRWKALLAKDLREGAKPDSVVVNDLCETIFVHKFLGYSRKFWVPQSSKGSQDSNWDIVKFLSQFSLDWANKKQIEEDED